MPSAARPRPGQCGEARSARRTAINPKPTGSARSAIQVGTPSMVMVLPAARSTLRSAMLPSARIVAIIEPMAPATMCAAAPTGPFGRNSPVASVSSLPSRAAIAAPSMPSQSVRFDANAADPWTDRPKNLRETISASGSSMIPASATLARRFSAWTASVFIDTE